jgi:hypothetical protein
MAGEIDRTVGPDDEGPRQRAGADLDDDVPEFMPPR